MIRQFTIFIGFLFLNFHSGSAQNLYYKTLNAQLVAPFYDTAHRVELKNIDSTSSIKKQIDYVLKFYPKMLVKNILVDFKKSASVAKTRPKFSSIFKSPVQRVYKITFSKGTNSTLDSVVLENLTFNSQIGLIAHQISIIEDMSTGGFFNFVAFYFKNLTHAGIKRIYLDAEEKTIEVGLGYQLLDLNKENLENLKIENWTDTKGYTNYMRHYKNRSMKPSRVINFINDMPVYVAHPYK